MEGISGAASVKLEATAGVPWGNPRCVRAVSREGGLGQAKINQGSRPGTCRRGVLAIDVEQGLGCAQEATLQCEQKICVSSTPKMVVTYFPHGANGDRLMVRPPAQALRGGREVVCWRL